MRFAYPSIYEMKIIISQWMGSKYMQWSWFCSAIKTLHTTRSLTANNLFPPRAAMLLHYRKYRHKTLREVPSVYVKSKDNDTVSNTCSTQRKSILYGNESSDVLRSHWHFHSIYTSNIALWRHNSVPTDWRLWTYERLSLHLQSTYMQNYCR